MGPVHNAALRVPLVDSFEPDGVAYTQRVDLRSDVNICAISSVWPEANSTRKR